MENKKSKGMRTVLMVIYMVSLALLVYASAPTIPTTISPANNSIFLNYPQLVCSGSTDAESDDIYIAFYKFNITETDLQFLDNNVCQGDFYCHANRTLETGTDECMSIKASDGDWVDQDCTTNQRSICELNQNEGYWMTGGENDWAGGNNTDCPAHGTGWHMARIDSSNENYNVSSTCTSGTYCWVGGRQVSGAGENDWWWQNPYSGVNLTLQNSTNTSFNWSDSGYGTFEWFCQACDDNGECSSATSLKTLTFLSFMNCTNTDTNVALNMSSWSEENRTSILNSNWDSAFTVSTSTGDSREYSHSWLDIHSVQYCIEDGLDNTSSLYIDDFIEWDPTNTSYSFPRQYYFDNATLTGSNVNNIKVYSLNDELSTTVTFRVTEEGVTPVEGALIHLQRYDPGDGSYTLVAMAKTSTSGSDIIYLRLTDGWYRIIAYDSSGVLRYTSGPEHITSTTYNIVFGTEDEGYSDIEGWNNFENLIWNLSWNNVTNTSSLIADDSTGYVNRMCLRVNRFSLQDGGFATVCQDCESSASVTLSCPLNITSGLYEAKFIAYHNSTWRLMDSLEIDYVTQIDELIGLDGPLMAFLLVGLLFFIGIYHPTTSIILGLCGFLLARGIGLITLSWGAVVGIIFVGLLLLFQQKGR